MTYITKEAVQKCLDDLSGENLIGNENDTFISLAEAKDRIEELPTADVVPKSETARDIIFDIEKELHAMLPRKPLSTKNSATFGNSFDLAKERTIYDVLKYLVELEKKYCGKDTNVPTKKTNFDRIKAMTVEEFSEFLCKLYFGEDCPPEYAKDLAKFFESEANP